ncbi:hypothetical protein KEM56_001696 [Ascosphaera pollenicola]|nr:hypothetical protein KEM56_001696 [Ascosphaera pollenicola]
MSKSSARCTLIEQQWSYFSEIYKARPQGGLLRRFLTDQTSRNRYKHSLNNANHLKSHEEHRAKLPPDPDYLPRCSVTGRPSWKQLRDAEELAAKYIKELPVQQLEYLTYILMRKLAHETKLILTQYILNLLNVEDLIMEPTTNGRKSAKSKSHSASFKPIPSTRNKGSPTRPQNAEPAKGTKQRGSIKNKVVRFQEKVEIIGETTPVRSGKTSSTVRQGQPEPAAEKRKPVQQSGGVRTYRREKPLPPVNDAGAKNSHRKPLRSPSPPRTFDDIMNAQGDTRNKRLSFGDKLRKALQ